MRGDGVELEGVGVSENEIAKEIVDAAYHVHRALGPGLLESVYQRALAYELGKRGLDVATEVPVPVEYESIRFDEGFRADLIVGGAVIVELKSVEATAPIHRKQVLTYLRLSGLRLGLLVNFGAERIKEGIVRLANGMPE